MSGLMLPDDLRAITVRAPFPFLVERGVKRYETRSRPMAYRGWLGLHTAVAVSHVPRAVRWQVGDFEVERDRAGLIIRGDSLSWPYRLPLGAITSVVEVVDCWAIVGEDSDAAPPCIEAGPDGLRQWWPASGAPGDEADERDITDQAPYGNWSPGSYAYEIGRVVRLRRPVQCRGSLSLPWRVPEDVAAKVREQLAEVAS